jgi:hypothetical protein
MDERDAVGIGINGASDVGFGVFGQSQTGVGVQGQSNNGAGVNGDSTNADAVVGFAHAVGKAGVLGLSEDGNAVAGISKNQTGVFGQGKNFGGNFFGDTAVRGESSTSDAVVGLTTAPGKAGVLGLSPGGNAVTGIADNGIGIFGRGGVLAGSFFGKVRVDGDVEVTGDVQLTNRDCCEDFDIPGGLDVEPGTVMAIGPDGRMGPSTGPYDKRVAGVVSGAGDCKPAITLGKHPSAERRVPIALLGKVYCKVDTQYSPVDIGDMLTTSPTPGYAMKASDPLKSFGAVIGKALGSLHQGQGLIPILVALQ